MKNSSFFRNLLLAGALSLLPAAHVAAQDQPYLARVWDSPITIPAGGYRAGKPVELDGKIDITTTPWTLIDNVTFSGPKDGQHWHLNGTIFRRVNLSGGLGVSMTAKDSVFENSEMQKTGGWFVNMWGSHWNFDNCIFTEKFLGTELSVANYQVSATRCTFYGVKLPEITYKGDPGKYLQKKNLEFVGCRFVSCNVPESFLAATVDCVFEDCEFPAKHENWPKGTSSIAVSAMYSGLTDAPQPFQNGPLSVHFTEAPANVQAGSTLPHSQMAGEITLTNYAQPTEYVDFGTVPKNSSEIAPPPGQSNAVGGTAPAGAQ